MMTRIYILFVLAHRVGTKTTYCPHLMGASEGVELDTVTEYLYDRDDEVYEDYFVLESPKVRIFSNESVALKCYAELVEGYLSMETLRYEDYEICGESQIEIIM